MKAMAVAVLCLMLGACATSRSWDDPGPEVLAAKVREGDVVTVVARSGRTHRFQVTTVGEDALYGRNAEKHYKIAFAAVDSIHVERDHPVGATMAVLGVTALVALGVAIDNMSDQNWDFCGGN